jgi:hypothetical protein
MGSGPDWRVWLGLSVTTTWLLLISLYIANSVGWSNIGNQPIQTLGNFLQKKELMQNTDAIKMQYVEIQKSAEQSVFQTATGYHQRTSVCVQSGGRRRQRSGI